MTGSPLAYQLCLGSDPRGVSTNRVRAQGGHRGLSTERRWRGSPTLALMLISTMNDIPGYEVTEVLGEVFGLTVRSRNIGSQIGAGLKALAGGELKGMTKNLVASRQDVITRLVREAEAKGADAVLAMRFDASDMGQGWTEICAYGTAI